MLAPTGPGQAAAPPRKSPGSPPSTTAAAADRVADHDARPASTSSSAPRIGRSRPTRRRTSSSRRSARPPWRRCGGPPGGDPRSPGAAGARPRSGRRTSRASGPPARARRGGIVGPLLQRLDRRRVRPLPQRAVDPRADREVAVALPAEERRQIEAPVVLHVPRPPVTIGVATGGEVERSLLQEAARQPRIAALGDRRDRRLHRRVEPARRREAGVRLDQPPLALVDAPPPSPPPSPPRRHPAHDRRGHRGRRSDRPRPVPGV